jgi:hypothetical protein
MLLMIRGVIGVVLIGNIRGVDGVGTLMGMPEMVEYELEASPVGLSS